MSLSIPIENAVFPLLNTQFCFKSEIQSVKSKSVSREKKFKSILLLWETRDARDNLASNADLPHARNVSRRRAYYLSRCYTNVCKRVLSSISS